MVIELNSDSATHVHRLHMLVLLELMQEHVYFDHTDGPERIRGRGHGMCGAVVVKQVCSPSFMCVDISQLYWPNEHIFMYIISNLMLMRIWGCGCGSAHQSDWYTG